MYLGGAYTMPPPPVVPPLVVPPPVFRPKGGGVQQGGGAWYFSAYFRFIPLILALIFWAPRALSPPVRCLWCIPSVEASRWASFSKVFQIKIHCFVCEIIQCINHAKA